MSIDRPARIHVEAQIRPREIECGAQQISPPAEHCIQIPRTPFESAMADCRGERHVALLDRDMQMPEDGTEMGIIRLVEDMKPMSTGISASPHRTVARRCLFVNGDMVRAMEPIGGPQP